MTLIDIKRLLAALAVLLLAASCGGGGGSSDNAVTPTPTLTPAPTPTPYVEPTPAPPTSPVLGKENGEAVTGAVFTTLRVLFRPSYVGGGAAASTGDNKCPGGGTVNVVTESADSLSKKTVTYTDCLEGEEFRDGVIATTYDGDTSNLGRIVTAVNLTYRNIRSGDDMTLSSVTLTYSGFIYDGIMLIGSTVELSGHIAGTVSGLPIDAEYFRFTMSYRYDGEEVSYTIRGKLKPSCIGQWLDVATGEDMVMQSYNCPHSGAFTIGDTFSVLSVSFSSDSGTSIAFNDEVISTASQCTSIEGLCGR